MDYVTKFLETRPKVTAVVEWGHWWQSINSLHIHVQVANGTRGNQIKLTVQKEFIHLIVAGNEIIKGKLAQPVIADDTIWTVEGTALSIELANVRPATFKNGYWKSLLADGNLDGFTLYKMRLEIEIEHMQRNAPEQDFSAVEKIDKYSDDPQDMVYNMMYKQDTKLRQ